MTRRIDRHDERGASLILAIVFVVAVGGFAAAMLQSVHSGAVTRANLEQARNREYAADGAVERAIAGVRARMQGGEAPCAPSTTTLNSVQIDVTCDYRETLMLSGLVARNVVFTARCHAVDVPRCIDTEPIIETQVLFQSNDALDSESINVNKTIVQSWSVAQ